MAADDLDLVFRALANPDRRRMLDLLRDGPLSTGEVVFEFPELTRFTVMQHLTVLARAALVTSRKEGRTRHFFLNAVPLRQLYDRWVSRFDDHWATALTGLKQELEAPAPRRRKAKGRTT